MEEKIIEKENSEIYSQKVRAGKRTYFFDIKSTKGSDFYLTITESKKRFNDDGFFYEKHKIFLYKEDIEKFMEALSDTLDYLKTDLMPEYNFQIGETKDDNLQEIEETLKWD